MKALFPSNFEIENLQDQYKIIEKLSSGPFSENLLVENNNKKQFLAVVSTNKNLFLSKEVEKLVQNTCFSILTPIGYSLTNFNKEKFSVLLFNYGKGSLSNFIAKYGIDSIEGTKRFNILLGIAFAIKHLHTNNQSYTFLHPDNIFLDDDLNPHLLYLGPCSIPIHDLINSYMSTNPPLPLYLAPEVLKYIKRSNLESSTIKSGINNPSSPNDNTNENPQNLDEITSKSDNYSFSLLVYYLISFEKPYDQFISQKVSTFIEKVLSNIRPTLDCLPQSRYVIELFQSTWTSVPENRISFTEIIETMLKHPFFKYFEIDIDEVTRYILNFEKSDGINMSILRKNDPNISEEEFLITAEMADKSLIEVKMANSIIEGMMFENQLHGDKDFDSQVDVIMYNGLKRRMNEIILFFEQRDNGEKVDDEWICGVAGFGRSSSIEEDNSKSKVGTDPNTSINFG